jgi:hypothetical protein
VRSRAAEAGASAGPAYGEVRLRRVFASGPWWHVGSNVSNPRALQAAA